MHEILLENEESKVIKIHSLALLQLMFNYEK